MKIAPLDSAVIERIDAKIEKARQALKDYVSTREAGEWDKVLLSLTDIRDSCIDIADATLEMIRLASWDQRTARLRVKDRARYLASDKAKARLARGVLVLKEGEAPP